MGALLLVALLLLAPGASFAQDIGCDPGDLEVRALEFVGNRTYRDEVLANGIATTASSWWRRTFRVFGQRNCLDSLVVRRDSLLLMAFYRQHGFPDVEVGLQITPVGRGAVKVRFSIDEGQPILVEELRVTGLDSLAERERVLRGLPLRRGGRFDIFLVELTRDSLRRRLRDRGYPAAEVLRSYETDNARRRAWVEFQVLAGRQARIGTIRINTIGERKRIDPERVKRTLGIREGQLYNETSLEGVKRGLYLTEAFRHVSISIDSGRIAPEDTLVDVTVTLVENEARAARVSLGWGNLDCLRAQGSHTNYNFLGALRRLDINARVSKVGVDKPFEGARGLCTAELLRDPLSDTLNYYLGVTYSQPALFRTRSIPVLSVYSERRSEYQAFLRSTPLGVAASVQQGVDGPFPMTWSYQLEYGRTLAQPAFFCAVFNVCEDAARSQLERLQRSAVLGWSGTRSRVDNVVSPRSGSVVRVEVRHASPPVGSAPEVQFSRATFDVAAYRSALGGALALRLRAGTVLGARLRALDSKTFIPLQERLYAGGANTVRGYRQNELGPAIYLPERFETVPVPGEDTLVYFRANPENTSERVVPTGGDNLVVANAELRLRSVLFPDLIEWALFADAGQVWNRGRQGTGIAFRDVKVTPGVGMRIFSFVGPIRVDVGYNPYARPAGPAYFNPPPSASAPGEVLRLICVSPGNTLRVRPGNNGRAPQPVDEGDCPATYVPAVRKGFLSRLTFNFSIGQPF